MTGDNFNIVAETPKTRGRKVLEEVSKPSPDTWTLTRLLAEETELEQVNEEGLTPLLVATIADHTEAACMLLAAGAKTDVMDKAGDTPLMHAVEHRNMKVVKDLLAVGAPRRTMESSMSSEMWDRLIEGYQDKFRAEEAQPTISVLRPLSVKIAEKPDQTISVFRPLALKPKT